jgi:hypothetical protein
MPQLACGFPAPAPLSSCGAFVSAPVLSGQLLLQSFLLPLHRQIVDSNMIMLKKQQVYLCEK